MARRSRISRTRYNSSGYRQKRTASGTIRDWNDTQTIGNGMVTLTITGLNKTVSWLRGLGDDLEDAILQGLEDAGEETIKRIQQVIDEGDFEPLAEPTPEIETRLYNASYPNEILKMNGDLYNSFDYQTFTKGRKYTLSVYSTCDYLAYHIFGVPDNGWGRRVPVRDPLSPVTKRFSNSIIRKIETPVFRALRSD